MRRRGGRLPRECARPGRHLHHEERVQAPEQDRVRGEEITDRQALSLGTQERAPGGVQAAGSGPAAQPLNPNSDYREWKRLVKEAGLREARLHDARHTAATVLLALRQPTPTVMSLMGWSSESMAARYQHVTEAMRTEVASQVGDLIWQAGTRGGTEPEAVMVPNDSLATVITFAEEHVRRKTGRDAAGRAGLLAAIADLRAALRPRAAAPGTSNEAKTETRRPERQ